MYAAIELARCNILHFAVVNSGPVFKLAAYGRRFPSSLCGAGWSIGLWYERLMRLRLGRHLTGPFLCHDRDDGRQGQYAPMCDRRQVYSDSLNATIKRKDQS